eukprot:gnl/Chilomastix_caulleri/965.p1 GENE.gnl/Chilomastix_caulleri/965~~gnl/Chilomastix_caulleri/965.p1  ORF type:complete len:228 (+),score=103.10 gnl/Chilomastix_caulleri/965:249-932(+)
MTQEEQLRGIRVIEKRNRDPFQEGDQEKPRGLRRTGTNNIQSDKDREWKYGPEFTASPRRRIIPPHCEGNGVIGVDIPSGVFTGREKDNEPCLRTANKIKASGENFTVFNSHDDVIGYTRAGEINPPAAQTVQRNPDKPTTYGGYVPADAQSYMSAGVTRRERKPAPWMQTNIEIGTDTRRLISEYVAPRTSSIGAQPSDATAAVAHSNQLYELNKRRYTRDSGPFF